MWTLIWAIVLTPLVFRIYFKNPSPDRAYGGWTGVIIMLTFNSVVALVWAICWACVLAPWVLVSG